MRSLPRRINPLILPEVSPPYEELLSRRRLGKTNLSVKPGQIGTSSATKPENLGMFEYAHLRAPLPKDLKGSEIFSFQAPQQHPEAYFLMRRSKDESETSEDEVAGNVWISPELALEIAKDYGMFDWVRALLDPTEIVQNTSSPEKHISPPPKFELPPIDSSTFTPSQQGSRRTRRSATPSKMASPKKNTASRKPRQSRAQREAASTASSTAANASLQSTLDAAASTASTTSSFSGDKLQSNGTEEPISRSHGDEEEDDASQHEIPVKKSKDRAHNKSAKATESTVESTARSEEDRVETRRIDLAPRMLPEVNPAEDSERMLSEAKKMVADAVKRDKKTKEEVEEDDQKAEPSSSTSSPSKKRDMAIRKRKAEEVPADKQEEGVEDSSDAAAAAAEPAQPAKRARLLEEKLRRERVRNRALVGVTATLALAAAIPYFL
ncbi:APSES transcription factor [Histoplasma capsulatum var. duboisii H88]|uniref:APSES transcription factor n=1 Tax=Ajellomyces capsulatus (strain H88) TaxID=544711 RepID=F0UMV9_AJEC8|nr:APSES transcription factor [Histoplasma capsulatum var. duboisii H88]